MIQNINETCLVSVARIILRDTGEMIDVSNAIVGIGVKNNYYSNKMPLFEISIKTTEEMRDVIRDNNINIFLQCNICDNTGETNELDSKSIYEKGILFSETIRIFEKPYVYTNRVTDVDNDSENDIANSVNQVIVKLSGVIDNTMKLNNTIFNELYYDTTAVSAAFNLLSRAGIKDIDLDEGYLSEQHKNILIPPMPPLQCLPYIQEYYNIYPRTLNTFLDVGNVCRIYDPTKINSYQNVVQINITAQNTMSMGTTEAIRPNEDTETGDIYIQTVEPPQLINGGVTAQYDVGSNIHFVAYDDVYNVAGRDYENDKSFEKRRIFWNPDNRSAGELAFLTNSTRVMAFSYILTNINPYRIGPRTLFRVISDTEDLAGDYSVMEMSYSLEPQGTESRYLSCMVFVTLSKINEND